jgi:transcriptional regulator NrdR family protein
MNLPTAYEARCPYCGWEVRITVADAHAFWVAAAVWTCPSCRSRFTTEELQREEVRKRGHDDP